ncbi:hypothetical protein, partial [Bradyrhizobium ottawaense]|uniref:hypothetical protein n=1 Tax=Bradyrhizobium ottawaense TaxID=931866 RepID=UPI0030C66E50
QTKSASLSSRQISGLIGRRPFIELISRQLMPEPDLIGNTKFIRYIILNTAADSNIAYGPVLPRDCQ